MFKALSEILKCCQGEMRQAEMEPMARHTTLKMGGPADMMVFPSNEKDIQLILKETTRKGIPVQIIGKGSNLLVREGGIRGLVVKIDKEFSGVEIEGTQVVCFAGMSMSHLAHTVAQAGLSGLEFAAGIPGTVGGGIYMNAGAYGGEMKDVVKTVQGFTFSGEPFEYSNADMGFAYRHSRAQTEGLVMTKAMFTLQRANPEDIFEKMADFAARRRDKQPLSELSCGSTFKRPEGHYAAALIEGCGLKGKKIGLCEVSEKHAGFLISSPGGKAEDYLALLALVQKEVYDKTGVMLTPEVRILGEEAPAELI